MTTTIVSLPEEFRPVYQYVMRQGKPQDMKILDELLWQSSGVVYARIYEGKVVYIGSTDGRLSSRIGRHVRDISTSMNGTAPRFREWAEGKQITIVAYQPPAVKLLGRSMLVHRAVEVALIAEFARPEEADWFVARR
jgi:hypothetical protein